MRRLHHVVTGLAVAALAVGACSDSTGPNEPTGVVRIQPAVVTILGDQPLQLEALDSLGVPARGIVIRWRALDTSVVQVDSLGVLRGISRGGTRVIVESGRYADTVLALVEGFTDLGVGSQTACAVRTGGSLWCWGSNAEGMLGVGLSSVTLPHSPVPRRSSSNTPFVDVEVGTTKACARTSAGALHCWGSRTLGVQGESSAGTRSPSPLVRPLAIERIASVFGSFDFLRDICAIAVGGTLYCWSSGPMAVDSMRAFRHVDMSSDRYCRVTGAGDLECRGTQLRGVGPSTAEFATATAGLDLVSVATGASMTCVLDSGSRAWCWRYGQSAFAPAQVPGALAWRGVDVARDTACGVTSGGELYCWGNLAALFGDELPATSDVPMRIRGLPALESVALAPTYGCVLSRAGSAYCWGANEVGQLGDGTLERRDLPVRVTLERQ